MESAIQLYTLRHAEDPLPAVLDRVGETAFDGVEFAGLGESSAEDVADALDRNDLEACSHHVGVDRLEAEFDAVLEEADTLGYEDIVIPWLDPEHFESVEAVEATAERLEGLAADLAEEGYRLHYHNHNQEFQETEDGVAYHLLADATERVRFQVDAGWAMAGGLDPVDVIEQYADRITLVHLKDIHAADAASAELGEGDLDLDAARGIDAEWLIYEHDQPDDPYESLEHGADLVNSYL